MTFSDLKDRVANETGMDLTTDDTIVGEWVNSAYKHICGVLNWPWLEKQGIIQTVADITTGTVSINSGSTSLTFSSAPSVSVANQYMIQFTDTSDDWYYISSHTASSTSATLSVPFAGSSNVSGVSYICRKVFYSLPSDLDRMIDARQSIYKQKLGAIDIRTFDRYLPDPTATGVPLYYYMVGLDTNQYWQMGLYPVPTDINNIQIRYLMKPATLSSASDAPLIPEKFHDVIVMAALFMYGHPFIDDTRFAMAERRYADMIQDMKSNYSPIPDQMTVIQPWDSRPRRLVGRLRYPPNYPEGMY